MCMTREDSNHSAYPELPIGGVIKDISKIIFLVLNKNLCCDPSLELNCLDETVLMMCHKIRVYGEIWIIINKHR